MKKSFNYILVAALALAFFLVLFSVIPLWNSDGNATKNIEGPTTTTNIKVVDKAKNSTEQWVLLSDDKKVYIDNFSIWALIEENENYTIVFGINKKTKEYQLKKIVPSDYNGQF